MTALLPTPIKIPTKCDKKPGVMGDVEEEKGIFVGLVLFSNEKGCIIGEVA